MNDTIAGQRLENQGLTRSRGRDPAGVVASLGAVQAQEYGPARWALALRMRAGVTDGEIARACDEGRILRTHVMRPTWHFVAPSDIRWMLALTAPRVHQRLAVYMRRLELDARTLTRGTKVFERALTNGRHLTRPELGERLARGGIAIKGVRLALLTMYAELEGVMCNGARQGTQLTYALLAQRAPEARMLPRDEALAELTRRYFTSHGPATVRDFVWWSGLNTSDAKRGLEITRARQEQIDGLTYWTLGPTASGPVPAGRVDLLPIYDEYFVAYRDRDAVPHGIASNRSFASRSLSFQNPLAVGGHVAGTWRSVRSRGGVTIQVIPQRRLTRGEREALDEAGARYGRFVETPVSVSILKAVP